MPSVLFAGVVPCNFVRYHPRAARPRQLSLSQPLLYHRERTARVPRCFACRLPSTSSLCPLPASGDLARASFIPGGSDFCCALFHAVLPLPRTYLHAASWHTPLRLHTRVPTPPLRSCGKAGSRVFTGSSASRSPLHRITHHPVDGTLRIPFLISLTLLPLRATPLSVSRHYLHPQPASFLKMLAKSIF